MTTFLTRLAGPDAGRPPRSPGRPASGWAFTGLAVTAFGGPLALAALYAPAGVAGASAGAGLAMAGAVALFAVPLVICLPAWTLTVVATAFALYGLWVTLQHSVT